MEKKVTVLTPNGRRQIIKVTLNTTILQILEEVCQKYGFDSEEYGLVHHNKDVGLSQMFRFSGLPNNCQLEMAKTERRRAESSVDICVQLEDGSRVHGQFTPTDNLWHIVEHISSQEAHNYGNPVAIYMRQEVIGRDRMSQVTLKSLGITDGRAMIRFINKSEEELKTQANVYVPKTATIPKDNDDDALKSERSSTNPKPTAGGGGFAITKDLVQSLKQTAVTDHSTPMQTDAEHHNNSSPHTNRRDNVDAEWNDWNSQYDWGPGTGYSIRSSQSDAKAQEEAEAAAEEARKERLQEEMNAAEPEFNIIGERSAIIFSLDTTQKQIENPPDSFYELDIHDLKLVLRDLKKVAAGNENNPLLTEKLRELEENKTMLNKIAQYKNCVIRIRFPDRHVLQGIFKPIDKIMDVITFVRKFLDNSQANFELFTIPRTKILPLDKTLLELDFVPTALVHFAWNVEDTANDSNVAMENFIKAEFLEKLSTAEGAVFAAVKLRKLTRTSSTDEKKDNNGEYERKSPGPSTGAIPKRPRGDMKQSN